MPKLHVILVQCTSSFTGLMHVAETMPHRNLIEFINNEERLRKHDECFD